MQTRELRIILTVDNLDEMIAFYQQALGLQTSKEWHEPTGNGIILDAGRASLELVDSRHAATIDDIEVGQRVAGTVRLAFNIGSDITTGAHTVKKHGGTEIAGLKQAPWSRVQRVKDPSGMQLTLFETSTLKY